MTEERNQNWEWEISSRRRWFSLKLGEILPYRGLLLRLVRRDIIASYQQTLLGPLWVFLQPLLTTLVYILVFQKIGRLSTGGIAPLLFYLPGIILWTYFSDCLTGTMYTFLHNAHLFNKVYFPRLVVPMGTVLFHSFRFSIQLLLFLLVYGWYMIRDPNFRPGLLLLLIPVLSVLTAAFAMGLGLILSVFIVKYRDIDNIMQFLIRIFMFATPVVYPASAFPERYRFMLWLNPLTSIIESFRAVFYARGSIPVDSLLAGAFMTGALFFAGLVLFRYREATLPDIA